MRLAIPFAAAVLLTALSAISFARGEQGSASLSAAAAWARATPPGADAAAAYVTIENFGARPDRLIAAQSTAAASVTIHESLEENGVAKMRQLHTAEIPAGGSLKMAPGGVHLMLTGLSGPLLIGEELALVLRFEQAGTLTVPVEIAPIGARGPQGRHSH